jgi:hypothetical protein
MHSGIAQRQQRLGIPDLGHMLGGQRKRDGALNIGSNWLECYTTGMFALVATGGGERHQWRGRPWKALEALISQY